mmetsp:Transcript_49969/g.144946  ORF Transcript_49969/g.144946 Transcript_49969/m.144946 type:complete len:346 (-) Transcript_49969:193-1230(-)
MNSMVLAIRTVSGEQQLDLELPADIPVCAVKDKIAEHWSVPPSCQKLILHGHELPAHGLVSAHCEADGAPLTLTMVLMLEATTTALEIGSSNQKIEALIDLSVLGVKSGNAGVALVSARLEDRDQHVRDAAVQTLGKVAGTDNPAALSIIFDYLLHEDLDVKSAAACATAKVASKGNSQAVGCLCARLQDEPYVLCPVLEALSTVARRGDVSTVAQILKCLQHPDFMVRVDALRALGAVAERGAEPYLEHLSGCLEDQESCVRQAAVEALGLLAPQGSQEALSRLKAYMQDEDFLVRRSAVLALADVAEDPFIVTAMKKPLEDEYYVVRQAAKVAISKLMGMWER